MDFQSWYPFGGVKCSAQIVASEMNRFDETLACDLTVPGQLQPVIVGRCTSDLEFRAGHKNRLPCRVAILEPPPQH